MKRFFKVFLTVLFFIPFVVFAEDKEKVKVYIFESGGCPYCEAEIEYLQGLESYNKKFEIVTKELYIDHIDWEEGKDFELGKAVAEEFNRAGYADAGYTGTPFVVISDIYAAATYSTDLERYIEQAYEEGDNDAVACIQEGKDDCIRLNENSSGNNSEDPKSNAGAAILIIGFVALIGVFIYVFKTRLRDEEHETKATKKVETKKAAKKAPAKKASAKKEITKKVAKKTPAKKAPAKKATKKTSKKK